MFDIRQRVSGASPELLACYREVATSTLGHFTDLGAITDLTPLRHPTRLLGSALTVRIPHLDGSVIRQALEMAEPGDVLVIDVAGDERRACWGELRTYAALRKGLAGVVTSGRVTDTAELVRLGLPIYSRGSSPLTTRAQDLEGEVNVAVAIDGVAISPGDLIVGDDDGLFALTPARAEALLAPVLDKQAREAERRRELMAAHPEWWR
ncbi:RraA family protein [Billgrantia bachuensis]|uniref:Putative 4-hydroxy-4-methyl-2-oxoglutarate aldolase n=1 Tax=Billgrantia bachuensis TaxID=2717286 RepID=A0ABX0PX33_9GAMM|nr:RraA family protein [Halomonas bachuensis]NIC06707.1 RraA family protein [Halomonas bachuensis]